MAAGGSAPGASLKQQLADRGFEWLDGPTAESVAQAHAGGAIEVSAGCRHALHPAGHPPLDVLIPVTLQLHLDARGQITRLAGGHPTPADIDAATTWVDDLIAARRLDDPEAGGPAVRGATHTVVREADGRRVVRRRGFDAAPPPA